MLAAFPYVVAADLVLIGSDSPFAVDKDALMTRVNEPHAREYLALAGVDVLNIADRLTKARFEYWTPSDQRGTLDVNTDMRPKDEFYMNNRDGFVPSKPSTP